MNTNPTPDALAEMKSCPNPWCDPQYSTPEVLRGAGGYAVNCCGLDACGLKGPSRGSEDDAREAWNTRPADRLEAFHAKPVVGAERKALSVLAEIMPYLSEDAEDEGEPDDEPVGWCSDNEGNNRRPLKLTFGMIRRARAALQSPPPVVSGEVDLSKITDLATLELAMAKNASTPPVVSGEAAKLERWGFEWKGHDHGTHVRMDDGYWTPWHLAQAALDNASPSPPVVEEGRREAGTIAKVIEEARAKYREPTDWDYGALDACTRIERAILALPVAALSTPATAQGDVREALDRVLEALTPHGETKAAYMGEFSWTEWLPDENGVEQGHQRTVPWTTIKEIMATIRDRAGVEKLDEADALATLKGQDNG